MKRTVRIATLSLVLAAGLLGGAAVLAPIEAGPKKPKPCTNCPPTIEVGGVTCTLEACGSDCVYTCPFPG